MAKERMIGKLKSAGERLVLFFLLPRQSKSRALRRYFRRRYDIDVGLHSYGCFDRWRMPGPLRIGRYCSIAKTVRVVDVNHPTEAITTHPILYERRFGVVDRDLLRAPPLVIEDDVWIGHNVVIMPGCKFIGRGAVVGAGSIVTRDVAPYAVVAGVPARVLRQRFAGALADALEASRWWMLEPHEIRQLVQDDPDLFHAPTVETVHAGFAKARDR